MCVFRKKYLAPDIEEGWRKRDIAKRLRKKKKRAPSPDDLVQTEITAPIIPKEPEKAEDEEPTKCYKCYRKKKRERRPKRQIR